ncbi:MAG: chromate transporter [bacterium]|nr:chromate transporter [bacterium]
MLRELGILFFKLGLTAFGGPAAHIAMMEFEIVEKRKWMTRDHFMDLIGATNLIPGPNSTEMAMHIGHERAGWPGLFAAGLSFIFPAFALTLLVSYLYVQGAEFALFEQVTWGIKPAMVAVIAFAVWKLGKNAITSYTTGAIAVIAFIFVANGLSEVSVILISGVFGLLSRFKLFNTRLNSSLLAILPLFWEFLRIGAVLYGSGYVLIAFLEGRFVDELGWLSSAQLLDAIAIGQLTPGPVLTTATTVGYFIAGFPGAILATLGIFLPSFFFVLALNPIIPKLRHNTYASGFLDGVNAGAIAIFLYVAYVLGKQVLVNWQAGVILVVAALLMWKKPFGVGAIGLIVISAALGFGLVALNTYFPLSAF